MADGSFGDSDRISRPLTIFTSVFFFFERFRWSKLACLFLKVFLPTRNFSAVPSPVSTLA